MPSWQIVNDDIFCGTDLFLKLI